MVQEPEQQVLQAGVRLQGGGGHDGPQPLVELRPSFFEEPNRQVIEHLLRGKRKGPQVQELTKVMSSNNQLVAKLTNINFG